MPIHSSHIPTVVNFYVEEIKRRYELRKKISQTEVQMHNTEDVPLTHQAFSAIRKFVRSLPVEHIGSRDIISAEAITKYEHGQHVRYYVITLPTDIAINLPTGHPLAAGLDELNEVAKVQEASRRAACQEATFLHELLNSHVCTRFTAYVHKRINASKESTVNQEEVKKVVNDFIESMRPVTCTR